MHKLTAGTNAPETFHVVIEIPGNTASPIKYEFDKDHQCLMVDRIFNTSMYYPCDYGYIPHTLAADGDPCDVLVITPYPLQPGAVIPCRTVGMLAMEDEAGMDHKIIALPIRKLTTMYNHINDIDDVSDDLKNRIEHFFAYYKKLEPNKWVTIHGWENAAAAKNTIQESIDRVNTSGDA